MLVIVNLQWRGCDDSNVWHSNQTDCDRKPFIHASDLAQWWQRQLYFGSQLLSLKTRFHNPLDLEWRFFFIIFFFFLARLYPTDAPWNIKNFLYPTASRAGFLEHPQSFFIARKL
ncbi:hypothetical protein PG997_000574 [Apiospora hydei]|uniref:Uncharacterized protein n=1 Tax=Apiospora hydei TaxID=1337664 RepID=A0ABR1XBB9_9PEZI